MDIRKIPTAELLQDWLDSVRDEAVCLEAIQQGIVSCNGVSVIERLRDNQKIVEVITAELIYRKFEWKDK